MVHSKEVPAPHLRLKMVRDQQTSIASFMTQPRSMTAHRGGQGPPNSSPVNQPIMSPKSGAPSSPFGPTMSRKRKGGRQFENDGSDSSGVSVDRLDRIKLETARTRTDADDERPAPLVGYAPIDGKRPRRVVSSSEGSESEEGLAGSNGNGNEAAPVKALMQTHGTGLGSSSRKRSTALDKVEATEMTHMRLRDRKGSQTTRRLGSDVTIQQQDIMDQSQPVDFHAGIFGISHRKEASDLAFSGEVSPGQRDQPKRVVRAATRVTLSAKAVDGAEAASELREANAGVEVVCAGEGADTKERADSASIKKPLTMESSPVSDKGVAPGASPLRIFDSSDEADHPQGATSPGALISSFSNRAGPGGSVSPQLASCIGTHRQKLRRANSPVRYGRHSSHISPESTAVSEDAAASKSDRAPSLHERRIVRRGGGKRMTRSQLPERDQRRKRRRLGKVDPDEEEETIDADALLSEIELDEPVVVNNRLRQRDKRSEYQKNLDLMKQRQLGKKNLPGKTAPANDSDDGAWTVGSVTDEEDWIAENSDDNFSSNDLPVNYRMSAHQSLEHHVKIIVQYYVGLVVVGEEYIAQQEATYFRQAFDTVRRKLDGMKDSATSSVWPKYFKSVLERYPEFNCEVLDEAVVGCDACRIGGRMSKYLGRLSGSPYDNETFESDDDSDEDGDRMSADGDADEITGPFKLGRYCRARAELFHDFSHWGEHKICASMWGFYLIRPIPSDATERAVFVSLRQSIEGIRSGVAFRRSIDDPDDVLVYLEQRGKVRDQWDHINGIIQRAQAMETGDTRRFGADD